MPLQSSGIIVVEKPTTAAAAAVSIASNQQQQQQLFQSTSSAAVSTTATTTTQKPITEIQYYEYYDANNVRQQQQQQQQLPQNHTVVLDSNNTTHQQLVRRSTQQRNNTNSSNLNATTIQQFNVKQQQQPMHQQQIIQHTTTHQTQQQQHVQQQSQQQQQQQQQVIQVSEDFIEQATSSGNMMISSATGEVLNQQIFKIVTADGATGNMIIDAMGNVTTTTTNSPGNTTPNNSKVLLSNLTVLSKQGTPNNAVNVAAGQQQQQQQPQTINFVSAKNLNYLTSAGTGAATTTTMSSATLTTPTSTANCKQHQQKFAVTGAAYKSSTTKQQTQMSTTYLQQSPQQQQQQIVQKVAVPRNVQMVTRVQTLMQPTATPASATTLQQPQMLLQQPQKYVTGKNVGNMLKKSGTLKMQQGSSNNKMLNNIQSQQHGVKTFIPQHQQQQQTQYTNSNKVKSKLVKQYNNVINNSVGAVAIATLPQQQQTSLGTYTVNHKNNQPITTTKITKLSNSKYVMQNHQQQQLQHVAANLPQGTQLHHKSSMQTHQQQSNCSSNIMLQQHVLNSNNSAGTIKFVNTHGTVIQQHQTQVPVQPQQKILATTTHRQTPYQQLQYVDTSVADNNSSNSMYQLSNTPTTSQQHSPQSLLSDDIMVVNGTQMTDELQARILQSMAQKSFNNQQRYQQQQQKTVISNSGSSSSSMPPPPQQLLLQSTTAGAVAASASNILLSPKEYQLYNTVPPHSQHQPQQQLPQSTAHYVQQSSFNTPVSSSTASSGGGVSVSSYSSATSVFSTSTTAVSTTSSKQAQSNPASRSQSIERKLHETSITRKSSDYYKVNNNVNSMIRGNSNAAATSGTSSNSTHTSEQTQVIHLQTLKSTTSLVGAGGHYATSPGGVLANDDDIIGEEVRPVPVQTQDLRLQILHAVLQDHTYANAMPVRLPGDLNAAHQILMPAQSPHQAPLVGVGNSAAPPQQWSLGGIGAAVAAAGHTLVSNAVAAAAAAAAAASSTCSLSAALTQNASAQSSYTMYGQQIPRMQQDDDAHSAISNGSRIATGEFDPGEETETAPEAEAEDDSVTRCICDLTHDDGYMICCDKCFAWQHVDCMGIDRQNIPDDYLCELCQPRNVDKTRARQLQLHKRKEQTQMLLTAQAANAAVGAAGTAISGGAFNNICGNTGLLSNDVLLAQQRLMSGGAANFNIGSGDAAALQTLSAAALSNNSLHHLTSTTTKKGKVLKKTKESSSNKKSKKGDKLTAANMVSGTSGGKPPRKETKKNAKRKSKSGDGLSSASSSALTAAEKHAANLRQWIENYELAVTNHYSPELRARLHAITKQPSLLQSILNTENRALKDCGSLENKATTVPHAGGKILISNLDISPHAPIFELRGKYMLTTQYRTQNVSVNMNTPPPSNYQASFKAAHKIPGPFIFFYQLPGAEAPMQTMNADGTYPLLPPQPAYLKGPEVCVDTRTYGNEARFVRRSCRPNAEIQHLFEKGTIHLFIVSLTDIRASTEITIRHEPHDLLAVETKRVTSNYSLVQPTSTPCACGLTKDCLFGPPLQHQAPSTSSTKSSRSKAAAAALTLNGSSAAMQLTMGGLTTAGSASIGKKKTLTAGNGNSSINRNRSTSSSGDSNMGLNSPNIAQMHLSATCNNFKSNNNMLPIAAGCSNMSNASTSTSVSMSSVMHDSGICTSSSSPSVSIPSPTSHVHSPTQQQAQQLLPLQQQQQQQQVAALPRALIMQQSVQQQHQQILAALPTPMLPSPQLQQQHMQPLQPQIAQPTLSVIASAAAAQLPIVVSSNVSTLLPLQQQPLQLPEVVALSPQTLYVQLPPQEHQQTQQIQQSAINNQQPLTDISNDATLAATAMQSLNTKTSTLTASTPTAEQPQQLQTQPQQLQQHVQQQQQQPQMLQQHFALQETPLLSQTSLPTEHFSPPQQQLVPPPPPPSIAAIKPFVVTSPLKSPQKQNNTTHANCTRKTPAKQTRTTSLSEDYAALNSNNEHSQEEGGASTSSSTTTGQHASSTPKEKPKLSREDRKMEAILRAIDKMEKNQQRKQELKQSKSQVSKRRNSNSPASPTKRVNSSSEFAEGNTPISTGVGFNTKRNDSGTSSRKKKRKSHKSSYNMHGSSTQRNKRRKSRMNSHESDADATITSESESHSMMSPPIQTMAGSALGMGINIGIGDNNGTIAETETYSSDAAATAVASANVDQAAGLLMAFANPKMSPSQPQNDVTVNQQLTPTHYAIVDSAGFKSPPPQQLSANTTVSPPPTPPAPVSSACLLIEAAVGPLEHLDSPVSTAVREFKYPPKTKTKKVLMSNWLNQSEGGGNMLPTSPNDSGSAPHSPNLSPAIANSSGLNLGLESLVQAALCDYKQQQQETITVPQNLSMAAKQVEEFIHQTERSHSPMSPFPLPTHEPHFNATAHPQSAQAVITAAPSFAVSRNSLQLPLQVSTCSNNSSVKKRWLRQAISEETTDDNSNASTTPVITPSTASPTSSLNHSSCSNTANAMFPLVPIVVPNGFTTPLKKRRLVISSKEEEEMTACNSSVTPPLASVVYDSPVNEIKTEPVVFNTNHSTDADSHIAIDDVDVVGDIKCEQVPTETDVEEDEAESEIVDVEHNTTAAVSCSATSTAPLLKYECTTKSEEISSVKTTHAQHQTEYVGLKSEPLMLMDQDDDVDILRSPSPGQKMVAEDNLVKIEPEDTSGGDDVKIDVEREESMAGDRFDEIMLEVKKEEEEQTQEEAVEIGILIREADVVQKVEVEKFQNITDTIKIDLAPTLVKTEVKSVDLQTVKEEHTKKIISVELKKPILTFESQLSQNSNCAATEHKSLLKLEEPLRKKPKLELQTSLLKPLMAKSINFEQTKIEQSSNCSSLLTSEAAAAVLSLPPPPPPPLPSQTPASSTVNSTTALVSTSITCNSSNANSSNVASTMTPSFSQNHERPNLSDDDIQERLLSFHKENILFLQSRNKKSKTGTQSSSSSTASTPESKSKSESKSHSDATRSTQANTSHSSNKHHHKTSNSTSCSSSKKVHKRDRSSNSTSDSKSASKSGSSHSSSSSSSSSLANVSSSVHNASTSRKIKSLKKSSSSSSNSSSNSHLTTTTTNTEKERNRHRSISNSSTSSSSTTAATMTAATPAVPMTGLKKRQLNFEQELTKDALLLPSVSSKHRKESKVASADMVKDESFSANSSNTKKRRESSTSGTAITSSNKHKASSENKLSTNESIAKVVASTSSCNYVTAVQNVTASADVKSQNSQHSSTITHQHSNITHLNNVPPAATLNTSNLTLTSPPSPTPNTTAPSNIPVTPSSNVPPSNVLKSLPVPIATIVASAAIAKLTTSNSSSTVIATNSPPTPPNGSQLPYFNTIYGKLLDNAPQQKLIPAALPSPSQSPSVVPPPTGITVTGLTTVPSVPIASPVAVPVKTLLPPSNLSFVDYVDTKASNYNTLGSYVAPSTTIFGLNTNKQPANIPTADLNVVSITAAATTAANSSHIEMPSPTTPIVGNNLSGCKLPITPIKILTKTASHDPRLNPILTAPEPAPAPKRKLSINEYRKRMQQSTDSNGSNSAVSTPTTPDVSVASTLTGFHTNSATSSSTYSATINKCSLNSPERYDNSTTKVLLLEKQLSTESFLNVGSKLYLSSSNSSESLLKSNEDDVTKGQFSAAPTLLEKQQENLCERLKSLKSKQSVVAGRLMAIGNDFGLKKESDLFLNRNSSTSDLDNCLEAISSSSTSLASSRESSPEPTKRTEFVVNRHHLNVGTTLTAASADKDAERNRSVDTA